MADTGYSRQGPIDPTSNFPSRVIEEKRLLHLPDWSAIDLPKHERKVRAKFGVNSALYLPLLRNGACIGVLSFARNKVGAFSEKEIALAESFRDQAVIAIENTRLFEAKQARTAELKESLEYQTATSEVLGVISRSPTDAQPVFDTIARNAARLCEAQQCLVSRFDGELLHFVAHDGATRAGVEATDELSPRRPLTVASPAQQCSLAKARRYRTLKPIRISILLRYPVPPVCGARSPFLCFAMESL